MLCDLFKPSLNYYLGVVTQYFGSSSGGDGNVSLGAIRETLFDCFQKRRNARGLHYVIVDLVTNSPQSRLKVGVACQNECNRVRLRTPHSANNRKPIAGFAD